MERLTNNYFTVTIFITMLLTKGGKNSVMFDVNNLLDQAIEETKNLKVDEIFLVKDLFKGYIWNRIEVKDRLLLGTLFLNYVHKEKSGLIPIEKTSSHQQRYQKIRG